MAGTYTMKEQAVIGDMRIAVFECTNFTDTETITVGSMKEIFAALPAVGTQDKMIGVSISDNTVTFDTGADTYDGTITFLGK